MPAPQMFTLHCASMSRFLGLAIPPVLSVSSPSLIMKINYGLPSSRTASLMWSNTISIAVFLLCEKCLQPEIA